MRTTYATARAGRVRDPDAPRPAVAARMTAMEWRRLLFREPAIRQYDNTERRRA